MGKVLEVVGVCKSFAALEAVSDLSFDVNDGEIVGLIGPNGAGKTTAINLITGATAPDRGRVVFSGEDVTGFEAHRLSRRGLVRTFQATNVYKGQTVRENVYRGAFTATFGGYLSAIFDTPSCRSKRATALARGEELLVLLSLDGMANQVAGDLPYGYQKMLGLAIALAARPKIILLDEPAAGLSSEEAGRVGEVIKRINEGGVAAVVVDHNMRFIRSICDRVVVMHHGQLLAHGSSEAVIADPRVIEAYLGSAHVA